MSVLLLYLVRQAGRIVARERLLADLWDVHWDSSLRIARSSTQRSSSSSRPCLDC